MSDARLRTDIWVQACVRRGDLEGIPVMVVRKGDPTAGAVLVKRNRFEQGCMVLLQTRDADGASAWLAGTGLDLVPEADADAYIARARQRDPDLWVIEIEDRQGRLPFEAKILTA
jgi:hypothetical protein